METQDTSKMILLYFVEKKKMLQEKKIKLEAEIKELAKINEEIKKLQIKEDE